MGEQRIEIEGEMVVREVNYENDAVMILPPDGDLDSAWEVDDLIREHLTPVKRTAPQDDARDLDPDHPADEGYPLAHYGRYRLTLERIA